MMEANRCNRTARCPIRLVSRVVWQLGQAEIARRRRMGRVLDVRGGRSYMVVKPTNAGGPSYLQPFERNPDPAA